MTSKTPSFAQQLDLRTSIPRDASLGLVLGCFVLPFSLEITVAFFKAFHSAISGSGHLDNQNGIVLVWPPWRTPDNLGAAAEVILMILQEDKLFLEGIHDARLQQGFGLGFLMVFGGRDLLCPKMHPLPGC